MRDSPLPGNAIGMITMEDIMEELIGEEIVDETDVFSDLQNRTLRDTHSMAPSVLAKAMFPDSTDRLVTPGEADRPTSWQAAAVGLVNPAAFESMRSQHDDPASGPAGGGTSRHVIRSRAASSSGLDRVSSSSIQRVAGNAYNRTLLDTNSIRRLAGGGGGGGGGSGVRRAGSATTQRATSLGSSSINDAGHIYDESTQLLPK